MALLDDLEQIASTLPANDTPDYHQIASLLGALIQTLEGAGTEVNPQTLEESRDAQLQAVVATGPRVSYGPQEAAKLSQVDELISKLQSMVGEQGSKGSSSSSSGEKGGSSSGEKGGKS